MVAYNHLLAQNRDEEETQQVAVAMIQNTEDY